MHGNNIGDDEKQEMVTNIDFKAIITSIKKIFFHQHMFDFVNEIELSDKKYQNNWTVRDDNYKGKFLFFKNQFLSFLTDRQSMYFMSTRLLKYKIVGVRVPQFQLAYTRDTTHPSHKIGSVVL